MLHHYVCFCEANLCVQATKDLEVRRILHDASLVLPDGVSMTLGGRLLGKPFPDRLPGPTVMLEYCRFCAPYGARHFFYGGPEGVARKVADNLTGMIPNLQVAGTYSPPFRPLNQTEEFEVKEMIERSKADVLWISLGAPKQEKWMAEHLHQIDVPLMLGVGAAFDFHSGNKKWAPQWIRKIGLEWVYRMFTGGRRVFIRNAKQESTFTLILTMQFIRERLLERPGSSNA